MAWPQATDYAEAVQNLPTAFRDPDIRAGRAVTNALGLPLARTGNFAAVFEVGSPTSQQKWAVKCFTRQVPGLEGRYQHVDAHLQQRRLSFMVPFRYLPRSVLVQGQRYPSLKMDWVEGLRLDEFLAECLTRRDYKSPLRTLCGMWVRMARLLRDAGVGHGDLQHGNVLLVRAASEQEAYKLRLVDYDGIYVPSLAGKPSSEAGHSAYQHPERLVQGGYGPEIDRFSHLLIYTTLQCLIADGPELWDRHYDPDRLLIGQEDLEAPETSPVFRRLRQLPDPAARHLVGHLILAAKGRLEDVPPLDQVVVHSKVVALTGSQRRQVEQLMSGPTVSRTPTDPSWPAATEAPSEMSAVCPSCGKESRIAKSAVGKRVRCSGCGQVFVLSLPGVYQQATPAHPPADSVVGPLPPLSASSPVDDLLAAEVPSTAPLAQTPSLMPVRRRRRRNMRPYIYAGVGTVGAVLLIGLIVGVASRTGGGGRTESGTAGNDDTTQQEDDTTQQDIIKRLSMNMTVIPAGEFLMGSFDGGKSERQHRVRISRPFYMSMYEVTQEEYQQVMGRNPSFFCVKGKGNDKVRDLDTSRFPVENVSWDDAVEFCRRLSDLPKVKRPGRKYRLPTEAEWEYACRAGSTTPFHFGSQLNGEEANCDGAKPYGTTTKGPYLERSTTVGSYTANAFGLCDMHGNVSEWCQDRYDEDYYSNSPVTDPPGPARVRYDPRPGQGAGFLPDWMVSAGTVRSARVYRGGSWFISARYCESADRYRREPTVRSSFLGFRVAADPPSPVKQAQASE